MQNLRDDIAGPLYQHRGAHANIFLLDIVLVMQGRVGNHHTANGYRFQTCDRGQLAGAANLNFYPLDHCLGLLGREFMRNRPARRAGSRPQAVLPIQAVHLVDNTIDVIGQGTAPGLHFPMIGHHVSNAFVDFVCLYLKAPAFHGRQHAGMAGAGQSANLAPGISAKA